MSGALRPFSPARAARQERAGRARGRAGAGLASHGGRAEPAVELAPSVRTSESAARRDRRDWRRGRSRAEACEPASLRARSLPAGRQLVAAEEGAEVGGQIVLPLGRGRRRRPARLPHTCVCVWERGRPRENVCATGSVFARPRAREPGARALGPGRDGGSRARLCAPSWQRRDSGRSRRRSCFTSRKSRRCAAGRADWRASAVAAAGRAGHEGGGTGRGGREGGRGAQTRGGKGGSAGRSGGSWGRRWPLP